MSIFARFLADSGGAPEQRTLTTSSFVPAPGTDIIDDYVGVRRSMSDMTVFACVRLLADTVATLPWKAYRRDKNNVPVEVKPTPAILRSPWPGFDLFQYKWMMVASMALRGNFFGYITSRNMLGYPTSILPLHPDIMFLERRPDILLWFDPVYRIMGEQVEAHDVLHMRRFTMAGDPWGLSPVKQAAVAIGMSLSASEYGYRYFKESANPSGILSTDQELDEPAVARQQKEWIASHGGRRLPAVLTHGFKFDPIAISPEESQFLATRGFQRSEICVLFGVPPVLIGESGDISGWGTGLEAIKRHAVTFTFNPWTSCMESVLSACLPAGQYVRFDYDSLLRGDPDQRYQQHERGIRAGFLKPNEARAAEELEPVSGGDILMQPSNAVPLGWPAAASAGGNQQENPHEEPQGKPGKKPVVPSKPIGGGEDARLLREAFNGTYFQDDARDAADADNTSYRLV